MRRCDRFRTSCTVPITRCSVFDGHLTESSIGLWCLFATWLPDEPYNRWDFLLECPFWKRAMNSIEVAESARYGNRSCTEYGKAPIPRWRLKLPLFSSSVTGPNISCLQTRSGKKNALFSWFPKYLKRRYILFISNSPVEPFDGIDILILKS